MSGDLLRTKLYVPRLRPLLVPRPRLIEKLNQGFQQGCKLTLVSAPAGFGKTTLIVEWATARGWGTWIAKSTAPHSAIRNPQFCWLSLDENDNDSSRFLAYVAAALQKINISIGETAVALLQSPQPVPIEEVLTSLLNDIASLAVDEDPAHPVILILDDYHHINAHAVHDTLTFLLDNLPPNWRLILISRSDPPLPLSRLRVRGQLTEIRQADLRFTGTEAAAFLNDVMGLSLTAGQVEVLESRTEGWIAGLQLAALSLRSRDDTADFIAAFSGSHRFVIDYLTDEALQQLDEETRRFLYQTAILRRLNADLCDMLTGRNDSQAILIRLEQANLFIVPLDDERHWYRYHHLFADLLRQRLKGEQQTSELHQRAAGWYAQNGFTAEAIQHSFAARDLKEAARLIEEHALSALDRGEMATVIGWLEAMPAEMVRTRPWLSIAFAWSLLLTGQVAGIESALRDAAQAVANDKEAAARRVLGHIAAIRAYVSLMMGNVAEAAHHAQEALVKLPEEDVSTRSVVTFTLGGARLFNDDVSGACRAFAEAGASGKAAGNIHLAAPALCALGTLQMQCGALHLALETFDEAQQIATGKNGRPLPVAAGAYNGKGQLFYEWNDLATAVSHLETAVKLVNQWGNIESLISSHIFLAQLYLARGDGEDAIALLQEANRQAKGKQMSPGTESLLAAGQIRAWLARGNLASAQRCAQDRGLTAADELNYLHEVEHIALARLFIAQAQWEKAEAFLARLLLAAEGGERRGRVIEILVLQAVVYQAQGSGDTAVAALERALSLAQPEGYVRTFLDAGLWIQPLLETAVVRGITPDYTAKLLAAFPTADQPKPTTPKSSGILLAEPLSEHELKVLRFVAAGLSNRETAAELYLSVNTVKWHLKNIYDKLDVHNRVEAIGRAQELGLLST